MGRTKKPLIIRADGSAMAAPVTKKGNLAIKSTKDMTEKEKNLLLLEKLLILQKKIEEKKAIEEKADKNGGKEK